VSRYHPACTRLLAQFNYLSLCNYNLYAKIKLASQVGGLLVVTNGAKLTPTTLGHFTGSLLWPPCIADADTIFCSCGYYLLLSFFFFPHLISAVVDWMSTILLHTMWPLCEFRMQVWNVLHAAHWKFRTQKWRKKSPSAHHRTTLSSYTFATKACIDNQKKNLLNSNISSRCSHNLANFGLLTAEIGWEVSSTPANFNGFRVLASLLQWRHSPGANQTMDNVWLSPGLAHYIYIFGGSCPWQNFATCKIHFGSKTCVLLYWQRYWTALQH